MSSLFEVAVQYGLAGVALWMMYNITYNHLKAMSTELTKIRVLLEKLTEN